MEDNKNEVVETEEVSKASKKEQGEKAPSKKKRILNGILLGIQIAFVVIAIVICIVVLVNPNSNDKVSGATVKLLPVQSNSMAGNKKDSFKKGALVIATSPKNGGKGLKVGDVVTFRYLEPASQQMILVTHRIIEIVTIDEGVYKYRTQGDNNVLPDAELKLPGDILAVYSFHINGLGTALTWVRDGYNFIYVIIIPLGLLLIYNIYLFAQIMVEAKMRKAKKLAAENALASIDEEEIKRKAIEEYLKQNGLAPAAQKDEVAAEEKTSEDK